MYRKNAVGITEDGGHHYLADTGKRESACGFPVVDAWETHPRTVLFLVECPGCWEIKATVDNAAMFDRLGIPVWARD
ncbi:hypothetical protein [Streptomyces sp. NPDC002644]